MWCWDQPLQLGSVWFEPFSVVVSSSTNNAFGVRVAVGCAITCQQGEAWPISPHVFNCSVSSLDMACPLLCVHLAQQGWDLSLGLEQRDPPP